MINPRLRWTAAVLATAVIAGAGCGTSPPGAGFASGDKPTFTADEKPAIRDDLQGPTNTDSGDAALAGSAELVPDPGKPVVKPAGGPVPTAPAAP